MFQEIAQLFKTALRVKLLKFFALQPDTTFPVIKITSALGALKGTALTELKALERIGIVMSRPMKGGRVWGWNSTHPGAFAVQNFVIEATTPGDKTIATVFRPLAPYLVVAAGALADETRGAIDLLIVTKRTHDPRITKVVKRLEAVTAVPIRYAVMEVGEYIGRRESYDRVLRDVFDFKHRVVVGKP